MTILEIKERCLSCFDVIVFDCDSTLTGIEGIDELAKLKGVENEVVDLTRLAMEGLIAIDQVYRRRLEIVRPTLADLQWLAERYIEHRTANATDVIQKLSHFGKKLFIVSGGCRQAIEPFAQDLGIPKENVFAVELKFDSEGEYLGFDEQSPLTRQGGKKEILKELTQRGPTLFVGDGATDLEVKEVVDLFVGFGGVICRSVVQQQAEIFIMELSKVIPLATGL